MQTPTVTFVETMRGQVVMTRFVNATELPSRLATPEQEDTEAVFASLQLGADRDLALPMIWQDLVIAVKNQPVAGQSGLSGCIEGGRILVSGLAEEPLAFQGGEFALLPATPEGERRMRYRLHCTAEDGHHYLLYGFKRIAKQPGRFLPWAIWQDTTTLYVTIYELDAAAAPRTLVASGVIHIQLVDFLKQLLTMRSRAVTGLLPTLRNLAAFGRFFTAGVLAAYRPAVANLASPTTPVS